MYKNHKGFTLVELIAVITILSIVIVLLIPYVTNFNEKSKNTLKDSKIQSIETAAEKYSNDRINDFQKCLGTTAVNDTSCKVSIKTLIAKGYLSPDDEKENGIIDPNTDEFFRGDILICYNPIEVITYASYSDDKNYSCGSVDIDMGNSFRLSSTNGVGYVNGSPIQVKIRSGGEFDKEEPYSFTTTSPYVTGTIDASKNLLILTPTKEKIEDPSGEATAIITVNGHYAKGTLSAEYRLKIKNTDLKIQDDTPYCLETGVTQELPLDLLNAGTLSLKVEDSTILDGLITGQKLTMKTGTKTGLSSIVLTESNGNRSDTIQKNVYKLEVGHIPSTLILGLQEKISVDYEGIDSLEITSSNPEVLTIKSESQKESGSIVLGPEEKGFTIVAKSYTSESVVISIRGTNGCGEYTTEVTVENTRLNIIDETDSCMEAGSTNTLTIDTFNAGSISIKSNLPNTLEASLSEDRLQLQAKDIPGRATITLTESNSNKKASVTKDVYKFQMDALPSKIILGKVQPINIDFGGLGALTITSSNPDVVSLSTSTQSDRGEITLRPEDKSFNLIAKAPTGNEKVEITIKAENRCIEKHFETEVGDFKLSSTSGTLYVGGPSKTVTIETDTTNTLSCTSSNQEVARCTIMGDRLIIEPWKTAGNAKIQVINEAGRKVEFIATVLDISLKVVDPNRQDSNGYPIKLETICSAKGSSVNNTKAKIEGLNYGALSVKVEDELLASGSIYREGANDFVSVTPKYLSVDQSPYKSGYNTGRTLVTVRESILGKSDSFYYNVYSLTSNREKINMSVNDSIQLTVDASNTGKLSVVSSDMRVAEAYILDGDVANFGPNVVDAKTVQVTAHSIGKTTLTFKGEYCGTISVEIEVEGKEYSVKIAPGTYTTNMEEQTLSCTTQGDDKTCDITLPTIPEVAGFAKSIGYAREKDALTFEYVENSTITLSESYNGFTLYANSKELIKPHCSSTLTDLVYNDIGDSYYINVTCLDNESGLQEEIQLNEDYFYTTNPSGQVLSISNPFRIENGITFRVEIKSQYVGLYDVILSAGLIKDRHGNANEYTVLGNFSSFEYEPVDVFNIGIPDPDDDDAIGVKASEDVVAVLYRNRDILQVDEDDTYTLKVYGKNSGTMVDFMSTEYNEFPKWTLDNAVDENLNPIDYKEKITDLIVEEGVKNIGDYLMYGVTNLKRVVLPSSITYIGNAAFYSTSLVEVTIPDAVERIRMKAFENAPIENVTFGANIVQIEKNAFYNNRIASLRIPNKVETIGNYAFYQPSETYMRVLTIEEGSALVELGEDVFPDLRALEIHLPYEIESLDPFKRREISR